ncbi:hypothetical protein ES703_54489 [subsurface metagenome]
MKFIPYFLIALSFSLLIGIFYTLTAEISDLKARDRLRGQEIRANRGYIGVTDDKCDRIKAEVADMVKPFTRVIPVRKGWWVGIREEDKK